MSSYIEKVEKMELPVLVLSDSVVFPSTTLGLDVSNSRNAETATSAAKDGRMVLVVSTTEPLNLEQDNLDISRLYRVGVVSRIKQSIRTSVGKTKILVEGVIRASVLSYQKGKDTLYAEVVCKKVSLPDSGDIKAEAYRRKLLDILNNTIRLLPNVSDNILSAVERIKDPGFFADFIAANILVKNEDKQTVLECFEPLSRMETLLYILEQEIELLRCEAEIQQKVQERVNRNQKDYYLREQIKVIQEELGDDTLSDVGEFDEKIRFLSLPEEIEKKFLKENDRLAKTPFGSAEANVLYNYLDICLGLPWNKKTKDRLNLEATSKILEADHDGLQDVKKRILEYLAVKKLNPGIKNQILCLVGPPGVGKTSIGASIARAMNRKYVRVSLGGIRDEAEIRGHRKTYVGAMPGRIIQAISQAGVNNPLILLDEVDKLTSDIHGDPSSALLEVLDAEQNKNFRDHFVEVPFDLSNCIFIATANTLDTVSRPLRDRMEIIELSSYTKYEKVAIGSHHLVPKQLTRHGLSKKNIRFSPEGLEEIIDYYTSEAGVRQLERKIADICRKIAFDVVKDPSFRVTLTDKNIETYLGHRKFLPRSVEGADEVGVVNGLAYTEVGGDLLKVEVAVLNGSGNIETTGSLGDVIKESARIAVSYVRSVADKYHIEKDFYKTKDIHIHFPEGAVPKDGPSAGVTIVSALISALTGRPARHDVAMTGEISLHGRVLPIGGLKEKTTAAFRAGVKKVLIPAENKGDLEDIDATVRQNLDFVLCENVSEVLDEILLPPAEESELFLLKKNEEIDVAAQGMPAVSSLETVLSSDNP